MMTVQQAFDLALRHHQAGRLTEAESICLQILAVAPDHADALHCLGGVVQQAGRHARAVELIERSLVLKPGNAAAFSTLGDAYRALGQFDQAEARYRQAIRLQPQDGPAHFNLGNILQEAGRLEEASAAYRRALELKPHYVDAHNNLGIALGRQGRMEEAAKAFRRVLELMPDHADAWNNLGIVLAGAGRFAEAMDAYSHSLELFPNQPEAYNNLGNAYQELGRFEEALVTYHRALEHRPDDSDIQRNLGNALRAQGRLDEAIAVYGRALLVAPGNAEAYNDLGIAYAGAGRLDEALAAAERAVQLAPGLPEAHVNLGNVLKDRGQVGEAIAAFRQASGLHPVSLAAFDNLIYTLEFEPGLDERTLFAEQKSWQLRFGKPPGQGMRSQANNRDPQRRLRVGYVSADFRDHVVGRNLMPLFKEHDHRAFKIVCYSGVLRPDATTQQLRAYADQWRGTLGVADEALAEMIRQDAIDILVDLAQHMVGNRLPLFARLPAPVQVSFAGYPASAGVEAIRYRISDGYLEGGTTNRESRDNEEVSLIDSFWCYDPCGMDVRPNALPVQTNGWLTFGSLNNFCKINDSVLKLWARVLGMVKDARLVLLSARGSHRQRTLDVLAKAGVQGDRVKFVERCARRAYLELYQRLDVVLDPFPYNGHTTSLDALWMGVPVVSLAGQRAVSRAGLSQLSNLGLRELVAFSEDEYVEIAARVARDLPRLAELRRTLRARMEASVLMDARRFARGIEAAYRNMWWRWCAEETGQ